ncbi:serine hydrolase [Lewinella sp. W8]|uniref:serine hydrolase domain-containing protein n=1 Tax=Lewinella sp. W8 TaxID=2528208 RepID=UPI0010671EBB|nr:serine hydrolase domain-containing protein [Lewinella sp. W8]MTB50607.1 serine hydrolase [Lewinella sp. W8]
MSQPLMPNNSPPLIIRLDGTEIAVPELDACLRELVRRADLAGLAVMVLDREGVCFRRAYGQANAETGEALRTDHLFYGASLSKSVFGYLVARLVQEGVLELDRPLQSYLDVPIPELPAEKEWQHYRDLAGDDRYRQLTPRMCLAHTTGFPNWRFLVDEGREPTGKLYFKWAPGQRYGYSGEGMLLLQRVIERTTGGELESLAREIVFDPLQMTMSSYVWRDHFAGKYCHGHTADGTVLKKKIRHRAGAAGSLETTPEDYARFMRHVMKLTRAGHPLTEVLFQPNVRIRSRMQFGPLAREDDRSLEAIDLRYTLGWGRLSSPHGFGYFKEGHDHGFQHYSIIYPQAAKGLLLMSNSDRAEGIFKYVLEAAIGDVYTPWQWENYVPFDRPETGLLPPE